MIHTQARIVFILALAVTIGGGAVTTSRVSASPQQAVATVDTTAAPHVTDAVAMVDVVDVSGSLSKAIKAMSEAETQQLASTLKPDDIYARVNFDGTARLAMLMSVREPADVERITKVVSQNISATGTHTSIAAGLTKAREVVEKERGTRRAVLVVITDGILSTSDGIAAERKRLEGITAWWKSQPWARRIVVGVGSDKTRAAAGLAKALDAELVTLDDYAKRSIVARAITSARTPLVKAASPPATPAAPPPRPSTRWLWLSGAAAAAIGLAYWRTRQVPSRGQAVIPVVNPLPIASIAGVPEMQITARVTASGRAVDTVVDVGELDGGVLTLGVAGTVSVPGLLGRPVTVEVVSDSMAVAIEPGANVRLNGENVAAVPQPIPVGRSCRLTCGGVAIALRLHTRGAGSRTPVALVGFRRIG